MLIIFIFLLADVVPAAIQAPPAPNKVVVAAATSGSVVIVAAALAALCAWYRLWGHVPLAASAASFFTSPRGGGAAGLEEASISLKVPEKGVVQVNRKYLYCAPGQCSMCACTFCLSKAPLTPSNCGGCSLCNINIYLRTNQSCAHCPWCKSICVHKRIVFQAIRIDA